MSQIGINRKVPYRGQLRQRYMRRKHTKCISSKTDDQGKNTKACAPIQQIGVAQCFCLLRLRVGRCVGVRHGAAFRPRFPSL